VRLSFGRVARDERAGARPIRTRVRRSAAHHFWRAHRHGRQRGWRRRPRCAGLV